MSKQIERAVEKNIRDADVDIIGERRRRAVRGMEGGSGWVGVDGEGEGQGWKGRGREKGGRGGGGKRVEGEGEWWRGEEGVKDRNRGDREGIAVEDWKVEWRGGVDGYRFMDLQCV